VEHPGRRRPARWSHCWSTRGRRSPAARRSRARSWAGLSTASGTPGRWPWCGPSGGVSARGPAPPIASCVRDLGCEPQDTADIRLIDGCPGPW